LPGQSEIAGDAHARLTGARSVADKLLSGD
jgi:hypothetical protein